MTNEEMIQTIIAMTTLILGIILMAFCITYALIWTEKAKKRKEEWLKEQTEETRKKLAEYRNIVENTRVFEKRKEK